MVQFSEAYSEEEILFGPSNNFHALLNVSNETKIVIEILLITDPSSDMQSEEDDHRVPLWVEVVWLGALIGTMVILLLNLSNFDSGRTISPISCTTSCSSLDISNCRPRRSQQDYTSGSRTISRCSHVSCSFCH